MTMTREDLQKNGSLLVSQANYEEYSHDGKVYVAGWRPHSRGRFSGWHVYEKGNPDTTTKLEISLPVPLTGDEENAVILLLKDAIGEFMELRKYPDGYVAKRYPTITDYKRTLRTEQVRFRNQLAEKIYAQLDDTKITTVAQKVLDS